MTDSLSDISQIRRPLSKSLCLNKPYDWSNPDIAEDAFILRVLMGCDIEDIAKCLVCFGWNRMQQGLLDIYDPLTLSIARRKLTHAHLACQAVNRPGRFLFTTKSLTLMYRVRSQDMYDLMLLMDEFGFSISNMVNAIIDVTGSEKNQVLTVIEILAGNIPVDEDDPGFKSIGVKSNLKDIYAYFEPLIRDYEVQQVSTIAGPK